MDNVHYIHGEREVNFGHNDRTSLDYFFAHYDAEGIINIGEETVHNQGGVFIARPFTSEELIEILKYLREKDLEFSKKLFEEVNKYHLKEYSLAYNIPIEELDQITKEMKFNDLSIHKVFR